MNKRNSTFLKELMFISTFLTTLFVSAQSKPGGSSFNVELWLKADAIDGVNNKPISFWQDSSNKKRNFNQYYEIKNNEPEVMHPTPLYLERGMNYNPTLFLYETFDETYTEDPNNEYNDNSELITTTYISNKVKLAGPLNIIRSDKAYYIYYVSKSNQKSGIGTVLSFNQEAKNSYGWNGITPWINPENGNTATFGIGKTAGINTVYLPNNGTGTSTLTNFFNNQLYVNGIQNTYPGSILIPSNSNVMTIGTNDLSSSNPFIGYISEIIVLSTEKGSLPDYTDMQKVNSYLALKYGITLPAAEQVNYFDSSGNLIWERNKNINYQVGIYGIGRDDDSGLYQKQSTNIEDESITVFLGDLKNTTKENTSTLNDKNFIIFGDNNLKTFSTYTYPIGTLFKGGTLTSPLNQRSNRILKLNKTGNIPFINIRVQDELKSYQYILVSEDENFSPSTTSIYAIDENFEAKNIATDDVYISFAGLRGSFTTNDFTTELWLDADQLEQPQESLVYRWNDLSENNRVITQNGNDNVPVLLKGNINYHSTLNFGKLPNSKLIGNPIAKNGKSYYVFYVAENLGTQNNINDSNTYGTIFSFNGNAWSTGFAGTNNWMKTSTNLYPTQTNFRTNNTQSTIISTAYYPNNTTNALGKTSLFTNGMQLLSELDNEIIPISSDDKIIIGAQNLANNQPFIGNISELIVLSTDNWTPLSITEVQKVNSYLALKYGITLAPTAITPVIAAQPNYFNSVGTIIWEGNKNIGFQNDIFGLGRDDQSGLYQKQATSYSNNSVTVFLNDLKATNYENTGQITDQSFLIFGSNGSTGSQAYSYPIETNFKNNVKNNIVLNSRNNRILKVNKTGTIGPVNLKLSNELARVAYLLVTNNNTTFSPSTTDLYPVTNGLVENIVLNDNDYISFITAPKQPGGSSLDVEFWLSADNILSNDNNPITSWIDQTANQRNFHRHLDHNTPPTFLNQAINYNPALLFNGTNSSLLGGINLIDDAKEYYIYYVSEVENNGYNTIFSFNGDGTGSGQFGWNEKKPWYFDQEHRNVDSYLGQPYAINAVYVPNKTNSTSYLYTNGKPFPFVGVDTSLPKTINQMVIGNNLSNGIVNPFKGKISEIIVLSTTKGDSPNLSDIEKVNSYLALKYGINLDKSSQPNLYNSSNEIIWNNDTHGDYSTDILGIGRDDVTNFYQKQSTNIKNNSLTLYIDDLKATNQQNTGIIPGDKSFILLGANDSLNWSKNETYNVPNYSISKRHGKIYKVSKKETGSNSISTINLNLNQQLSNTSHVLVSNTPTFDPSTTRFYEVNDGSVKGITLNDNDYIGFAVKNNIPGGLVGLNTEFWLVADDLNTLSNGADVNNWPNRADNTNNFTNVAAGSLVPVIRKSGLNYHYSVDFPLIDAEDGGPTSTATNNQRKLISQKNFTPSGNRSYFFITVSRVENDEITGYNTVFTLNTNNAYGWYKDSSGTRPWVRTRSTNYTTALPNEKKTYGINIAMLPNTANNQQHILLNADSYTVAGRTLNTTSSVSILGSRATTSTGTTNYYRGEIMEVLVLSKDGAGQILTENDLIKLNTYYALKYGISLDNSSQKQYQLSNGNVIYDTNGEYSTYNQGIFGLVRDDNSNLYQKQSISAEDNAMTIYQGELAASNNENTSTELGNNESIILGATGNLGESTPYLADVGTEFKNKTLQTITDPITQITIRERLSKRYNYTYRAKVTKVNNSGDEKASITINLAPNVGQWVLISDKPDFKPLDTDIYKIEEGRVLNVKINDGDYIAFGFYLNAPGGITNGLRMWLNASATNTISYNNTNNQVLTWTDYSGIGTTYRRRPENNESATYVKADERTNFHPTLVFDSRTDYLITDRGPMTVAAPANSAFYTVINHNFARDRSYFLGYGTQEPGSTASRRPVFGVYASGAEGLARIRSTTATNSLEKLFNPGATMIAGYHWKMNESITFEFDAHSEQRAHTYNASLMNGVGMLGAGSLRDAYLEGTLPEVIAYERELDNSERQKINSYLGLKYGITLDLDPTSEDINYQYKFSNNTYIWNGDVAPQKYYHNNVTAIIKDEESQLFNRQAKSTNLGDVVHMGIGKSLGVNAVLAPVDREYSALVWGNNGKDFTTFNFGDDSEICGKMDSRIAGKIWLATPVNFEQEVILRAAQGSDFPYNGPGYQVYLLLADSPDKLADGNNKWDQIIPMTYVDGGHQINYKFTENTYFTFGGKATGTCESCEFEGEKKLEFTRATWPRRGDITPHVFNLGNDFNVKVTIEGATNQFRSRYPRYSSRKSLRERRNGVDQITTVIEFTDNNGNKNAAATSFDLLDIDRVGYKRDDVEIVGYCSGFMVYPIMGYSYRRPERSRYLIGPNGSAVGKAPRTPYSGNSGYTNARAMAYVEFETPVDRIEIRYKTRTARPRTNNTQEIGIGAMNFYCVAPLPAPNEDGLIFTKQASVKVLLCETVDYTFRVINTNCDEKEFTLEDPLPKGMKWDQDSFTVINPNLSIDPENPDATAPSYNLSIEEVIIDGEKREKLTVKNLKAPGGGSTYTLRAKAYFEFPEFDADGNQTSEGAKAGNYDNSALIKYIANNQPNEVTLASTDRLTGNVFSRTEALDSERPQLITTKLSVDKTCYNLDQTITVKVDIYNPNEALDDMVFDFDYDAVTFNTGSLNLSSGITVSRDGEITYEEGSISIDGFSLAKGNSTITLTFKTYENLSDYYLDANTLEPIDIFFSYDLSNESEDPCSNTVTINASEEKELSYCTYCTQPPVGGTALNSDTGVSTLKNTFTNWPSEVPNGFLVLESGKKGMVLTRTKPEDIATPVQGMIIYNTVSKCISIYNGAQWKCIERACNE